LKRREFIAMIGDLAVSMSIVLPLSALAQQGKVVTIGVLVLGTPPPEAFLKGLREGLWGLGYTEGQNIKLEILTAEGKADILAEKAAELVRLKVDIIVASQTLPATAAKQATGEIPIVMASVGDPVGTGLVASLARPGGNVTGTSAGAAEVAGKTVELIREVIPSARQFAVLANEIDPFTRPFLVENSRAAQSIGLEMQTIMVLPGKPLEAMFMGMIDSKRVDAVIIQGSLLNQEAVELAMKHRLPMFSASPIGPALGCLASYTANLDGLYRDTAVYIDKILRGGKPADLPVSLPTRFELIINLKTAKSLGLDVPALLLARADRAIE
jgi:putative ABC transport system substrate-binding protein